MQLNAKTRPQRVHSDQLHSTAATTHQHRQQYQQLLQQQQLQQQQSANNRRWSAAAKILPSSEETESRINRKAAGHLATDRPNDCLTTTAASRPARVPSCSPDVAHVPRQSIAPPLDATRDIGTELRQQIHTPYAS